VFNYTNDSFKPKIVNATTSEIQTFLQNAGTIAAVQSGSVASAAYVSFALVNQVSGQNKGFEAILNPTDGAALMNAIRGALQSNAGAQAAVSSFTCATALAGSTVPIDVSSSVSVTLSGIRLNRSTGRFVGTATLKNNGASAVQLPLSLVLALPTGVSLVNGGVTCSVTPAGRPYTHAQLTGSLTPGASVQIPLEFINQGEIPITATTQVVAGPGSR
jgi:hypothetical protein